MSTSTSVELWIEGLPERPEAFAVQMSNNDQRFTAAAADRTGRTLVAWHDTQLRIVICEDVGDKLKYLAGPLPTSDKCSCVALVIPRDGELVAYYGARTEGNSGPFPLMKETCRISWLKAPGTGGDAAAVGAEVAALRAEVVALQAQVKALAERSSAAGRALVG